MQGSEGRRPGLSRDGTAGRRCTGKRPKGHSAALPVQPLSRRNNAMPKLSPYQRSSRLPMRAPAAVTTATAMLYQASRNSGESSTQWSA